jgi:hypothetical protein
MNRFLSTKNTFTVVILWCLVLFLISMLLINIQKEDISIIPFVIISLVTALIIWILLDTRYVIKNSNLLYRSGPFRGKIDITKINKIRSHSGLYVPVMMKPALDTKGFIVTYNKFDEVFISPKKADIFLKEVLKINSNIEVA